MHACVYTHTQIYYVYKIFSPYVQGIFGYNGVRVRVWVRVIDMHIKYYKMVASQVTFSAIGSLWQN